MTATVTISPTSKAMKRRAEARDYAARVIDPVIDPAIQCARAAPAFCDGAEDAGRRRRPFFYRYLRMQKPGPSRVLPTLLSYLQSKQEGEELEPDRSKLKLPPMAAENFPTAFLTPLITESARPRGNRVGLSEILPSVSLSLARIELVRRGFRGICLSIWRSSAPWGSFVSRVGAYLEAVCS